MATLLIQEYARLAPDVNSHRIQAGEEPAETSQSVTYTTSTQSAAFGASTKLIRVIADADVHLAFGTSPTATAASMRVTADTAEYFGVVPGHKVAAYDGTS